MIISDYIGLIFSGTVAISTVVYACLTNRLVKETRETRLLQITPNVHIYLSKAETEVHFVYFIIENIGYGIALDVKFSIVKDFKHYEDERLRLKNMGAFKHGLRYFYPKQKYKYYFTNLLEKFEEKISDSIEINLTFRDITNKVYSRNFVLRVDEILGTGKMVNPPDSYIGRIWFELSEIKKLLKKE